tara:strand:- start:287 stop:760 length:474 start_codon:yes stop_codon:yes gene_type:complete
MTALSSPVSVDPNNVSAPSGLIADGTYPATVTGAVEKTSKKNNNYLEVEFTLLMGRKIWTIFNLWNANQSSREMATKEFNKLGAALGVTGQVVDTDQLFGRELNIVVGVEPGQGEYGPKNIATDFLISTARQPPGAPLAAATQPAAPPVAASPAPWA